jgi:hypothetical protein
MWGMSQPPALEYLQEQAILLRRREATADKVREFLGYVGVHGSDSEAKIAAD